MEKKPTPRVRVMLVDDHEVVRVGLRSYLEAQTDFEVVAEAGNGEEALALAQQVLPDVIVMDITMAGMDGLEATRRLKALCPPCKVLALTVHTDEQHFFEMLAAGADGYLTKQAAADDLVEAIRTVAMGHSYLQPALASWLLTEYRRLRSRCREGAQAEEGKSLPGLQTLSRREMQVLEYIAQGMTSADIGQALGISPKTVSRHRENIMRKLNLHSSVELVRFAIRAGVISEP